jgi:adenylate cyclase
LACGIANLAVFLTDERAERRLAAILAADVAGYSRLMGADEEGTLAQLKAFRKTVVDPAIALHRGRIVKTTGDGMLVEFASAVDAARCAIEVQRGMAGRNADVAQDVRLEFRIGIHVGDIIVDDNDIFGDGVNIAARLEGIAEPGGVCISDDAYRQIRGKVDIAFDDMGSQTLKNITEPMRAWRTRVDGDVASISSKNASGTFQPHPLPGKPSIAVLPFENMSRDADDSFFIDGIADELITSLSYLSALFVIARNSTFAYKGKARDLRQVGRELGVRYILDGSVRRAGNRIRVTAQLVDSTDGGHVWADRYDRPADDVFEIQDDLTREIVTALRVVLTDGEQARLWQRSTDDVSAWTDAMRGVDHIWRASSADMATGRKYLLSALARDPSYARAEAMVALTHYFDLRYGYTTQVEEAQRNLMVHVKRALALNAEEPIAITLNALDLSMVGRFDEAAETAKRACEISPNEAMCWLGLARILINAERLDEGEQAIRAAMRLNPFYPVNYLAVLADALVHQGRNAEAVKVLGQMVDRNPNFISAHLHLAGLYGQKPLPRYLKLIPYTGLPWRGGSTCHLTNIGRIGS